MSVRITIKDKEFERELKRFSRISDNKLYSAIVKSTTKMHKTAIHQAPVDDGGLRQGIVIDISRAKEFTGEIESQKNYSQAVEEGTRPHHIEIKKKKVLAGKGVPGNTNKGGWSIWGKRAQHPGTKPQPFMRPAFNVGKKILFNLIKQALK